MEALAILLGIGIVVGLIATPIMLMVALSRLNDVRQSVNELRMMIFALRNRCECEIAANGKAVNVGDRPRRNGDRPLEEAPEVVAEGNRPLANGDRPLEEAPEVVAEGNRPLANGDRPQQEAPEVVAEGDRPLENGDRPLQEDAGKMMWGEALLSKFGDWLAVRGDYAPKGVTREFAVATRWLVRVGLMLLVGSVIYFVKLSIDSGWMGPTARVMGTLFWGAVGVAGGVALVKRTRYGMIGHALAALGVVALYLGFGLGHRFFDPPVIPSWQLAFSALVGVTVVAGIVSILLPSSTLAVMGLVGGYLVPVIAGHDSGHVLGLCAYLLVLNLGATVVASFRKWQGLNLIAVILAYVMMFAWGARHEACAQREMVPMFVFLSLIHTIYLVTAVWMSKRVGDWERSFSWLGVAINALAYLTWLGGVFRPAVSNDVTGLVFLAVVAGYLALARQSMRMGWLDKNSVNLLLVFALVFLSLTPLLLFAAPWCAVSWALIAIACSEVACRQKLEVLNVLSAILICVASCATVLFGIDAYCSLVDSAWHTGGPFVLRLVRIGAIPLAVGFLGYRTKKVPLIWTAGVMAFFYLTGEAHRLGADCFPILGGGTVTLTWGIAAALCLWNGIVKRFAPVRFVGLFLMGISVVKLLLLDTASLQMPSRVAVFAVTGVLLMAGAFLYLKFKAGFEGHE